jgi:hypothetical protein
MEYTPTSYRAMDVWITIRERGLDATARECGVSPIELARYALILPVSREHARAIEQSLLAGAAA